VVAPICILDLAGFVGIEGVVLGIPFGLAAAAVGWLCTRPVRLRTRVWRLTRVGMWGGVAAALAGVVYTVLLAISFAVSSG
jgi:hypothetical protein